MRGSKIPLQKVYMSLNNIFPELEDKVYQRFSKVPTHMLAGTRPDPYETRKLIPWILQTKDENYNIKTKERTFNYEDEVIEFYSKFEADAFKRSNRQLFDAGVLKVYESSQEAVDESNTVPDSDLVLISNVRSNEQFLEEISKFTSVYTLERLKKIATDAGKSVKKIQLIEDQIEALKNGTN
jgi:hypothetical protein